MATLTEVELQNPGATRKMWKNAWRLTRAARSGLSVVVIDKELGLMGLAAMAEPASWGLNPNDYYRGVRVAKLSGTASDAPPPSFMCRHKNDLVLSAARLTKKIARVCH